MRKSLFGVYHPMHKLCLLGLDLTSIAIAFHLASKIRLGISPNLVSPEFFGLALIIVTSLFLGNGYTSKTLDSPPHLPLNTLLVVLASALPATLFIYFMGPDRFNFLFGRGIFPVAIICTGIMAMIVRILLNTVFRGDNRNRSILVIGDVKVQDHLETAFKQGLQGLNVSKLDHMPTNQKLDSLDAIVITPNHLPSPQEQAALISARLGGTPIFSLSDFFEKFLFLVPVNEINNDWLIRAEGFTMLHSSVNTRLKRAVDLLGAGGLLILSIPTVLVTAILIKISSKGPVFFPQKRVGLKGKVFTLYKFRTMRVNAEPEGAKWAQSNDERIFPLGRFLRKTRIDELPQCWNIFKGEMSLIGPRPERPEFTSQLAKEIPYYDLRHIVKPGLTGWAQVCYRYGSSTEDALRKLQFDLYYIKNYSLLLDLNILLRTIQVTMRLMGR